MFRKILNYCKKIKISQIILLLVILVAIPVAVFLTRKITKLTPSAALATVDLYIEPATSTLPPDGIFKVYLDPKSQKITFVKVVLNFDKTKVQLSSELSTTPLIGNVIDTSSMSEANSSGKVVIIMAVPPNQTPPSGIFEIANFGLKKISTVSNDSTIITFDSGGIQIVEETAVNLTSNIRSSNLTLNPVANIPTNPISVTATVPPTSIPTSSPTKTPTPTNIPTPTLTMTPTVTPTKAPTFTPTPTKAACSTTSCSTIIKCCPGYGCLRNSCVQYGY